MKTFLLPADHLLKLFLPTFLFTKTTLFFFQKSELEGKKLVKVLFFLMQLVTPVDNWHKFYWQTSNIQMSSVE